MGLVKAGKTLSLTGKSVGEAHGVLECTQAHPLGNQHLKRHNLMWEVREVTESGMRGEQVLSLTLPLQKAPQQSKEGCPTLVNT